MFYANDLVKSFGSRDLLGGVSFIVGDKERVGLVGQNGAGKSTLLRIIAGEMEADEGAAGARGGELGFLKQEANHVAARSLLEELWTAFPEARAIEADIAAISHRIEAGAGDLDELIAEQGRLFDAFDALNGYRIESRIGRVLDGLGFAATDRDKRCGDFSGGWQMRIALAKILVRRPDNVMFDEPTNHLDVAARTWLLEDLRTYPGTILMVTHDHEFMDGVVGRVLELEGGSIESYTGNYTDYQRQKAARQSQLDRAATRQDREIEKQTRFIERFRAKATKASAVQSREKALARIDRIERPREQSAVKFDLKSDGRSDRDVLLIENVSHAYGDHLVLLDVTLEVERGQRVVLVGPNGGGKSTLLRLAAGLLTPSEGRLTWGDRVRFAYYDQHQDEALAPDITVLDAVKEVSGDAPEVRVRSVLGQFLFRGDDVFKQIRVLSGGERSRVALARLLIQPSNVLVLDEPTNHLDRATRRQLIDAMKKYPGTILCASHDQTIVDRIATRVFEVKDTACREVLHFTPS